MDHLPQFWNSRWLEFQADTRSETTWAPTLRVLERQRSPMNRLLTLSFRQERYPAAVGKLQNQRTTSDISEEMQVRLSRQALPLLAPCINGRYVSKVTKTTRSACIGQSVSRRDYSWPNEFVTESVTASRCGNKIFTQVKTHSRSFFLIVQRVLLLTFP